MNNRSGLVPSTNPPKWWKYRLASALRSRRSQTFFREMMLALDALPNHRLIAGGLEEGCEVCALGALGRARGLDLAKIDPADAKEVARLFKVSETLVRRIAFQNDNWIDRNYGWQVTPSERWACMRAWVKGQIEVDPDENQPAARRHTANDR